MKQGVTAFPEVNSVLCELLTQVQAILGDRFFGLYLYGSLATGDFDPERSDIDFLVVTNGELADSVVAKLRSMHTSLASSGSKWANKLEGTYLPLGALRVYRADDPPRPTVNEGRFYLARHGSDWVIQRHTLREYKSSVSGPNLRNYIDPVRPADLRLAVQKVLQEWWAPHVVDPRRLENPEYQAFAVLTMCRALYTLEHGTVVSKVAAGRWAVSALNGEWTELIGHALEWRPGHPTGDLARTVEFVRYVVARSA